jgi:chemotaxis signal transduction protein
MPVQGASGGRYLLVKAGESVCGLPLDRVRQVVPALNVYPLPTADPHLLGLAEYGGEPLPVFDLCALVRAHAGPAAEFPVTVVAWAGSGAEPESVGLAADGAVGLADLSGAAATVGDGGLVHGEVDVDGAPVRLIDLSALGAGA